MLTNIVSIDQTKRKLVVSLNKDECKIADTDADILHKMLAQNLADVADYQRWAAENPDKGTEAGDCRFYFLFVFF